MTQKEKIAYWMFAVVLLLMQFVGYAFVPLLVVALALLFRQDALKRSLLSSTLFAGFLVCSLIIGLWNTMTRPGDPSSLARWAQFYFFAFMLMGIDDKRSLLFVARRVVFLIFAADLVANILQVAGVNLSWVTLAIRPGELLPRFQGIKGSSLYSGSISFLAICFLWGEHTMNRSVKALAFFAASVNLLLAGSLRYFIVVAAVALLVSGRLYCRRHALMATCCAIIAATIVMTRQTMAVSESNYFRYKLWMQAIDRIADAPLLGHGFVFQSVSEHVRFTVRILGAHDVTESSVLLMGLCFGVPVMLLFLAALCQSLTRFGRYDHYAPELGLCLGLSLDLFWGGSLDNCMSLAVWLLAMYMVNEHPVSSTPKPSTP